VEALTDAIGLRALGLGARVIDVLDREIKFILVLLWVGAILTAAVGQYAQQLDLLALEEREHAVPPSSPFNSILVVKIAKPTVEISDKVRLNLEKFVWSSREK
jgi:hypothetical protein